MIDPARLWRLQLENGLRIVAYPRGRLPLLSLNAFILSGKDQNPIEAPGTSCLTSRLLDEGTGKYDHKSLARILESSGGHLSTFSQREMSGLSLQLTSNHLNLGVELLAEMVRWPVFPVDRFEIEKKKVLNHLKAIEDDPGLVGSQLLDRQIYRGTTLQFPVLGTPESVQQLQVEDLRRFHRENYCPENTILIAVGDLEGEAFWKVVRERFEGWEPGRLKKRCVPVVKRQQEPIEVQHPMPREQVTIYIGHLGVQRGCKDYYCLEVMDAILGGGPGFTSRIPQRIRDEMGLAYQAFSDICGSAGTYPGRFAAYVSTSPKTMQAALTALLQEINKMIAHPPSEEEVSAARRFLTGSFVFQFEGNDNLARFLLATEILELPSDFADRYPAIIKSVGVEDVARVARKYLDTVNYTAVLVGSIT